MIKVKARRRAKLFGLNPVAINLYIAPCEHFLQSSGFSSLEPGQFYTRTYNNFFRLALFKSIAHTAQTSE